MLHYKSVNVDVKLIYFSSSDFIRCFLLEVLADLIWVFVLLTVVGVQDFLWVFVILTPTVGVPALDGGCSSTVK